MRRSYPQDASPRDATIERLRSELYSARRTILELTPPKTHEILTSYHLCETSDAARTWQDDVAEALVELATPLPNAAPGYFPNRAYCPLCQCGSSSPYANGFTLTEGLRRHLIGWGNVPQCDVMAAAIALARDDWRRFDEADAAEALRKRTEKEQRKRTEDLYRLGPKEEPQLLDEIGFGRTGRNSTELMWAEQRLSTLGFQVATEGRIKSYLQSGKDYVVYADPRTNGEISFRVYWLPPPKRFERRYAIFSLMDTWKHDLPTKYKKRLGAALSERLR